MSDRHSILQRISSVQGRKAAEVPIGGPELRDTVRDAHRRDPCVVHRGSFHSAVPKQILQHNPVLVGLGKHLGDRRFEPDVNLILSLRNG